MSTNHHPSGHTPLHTADNDHAHDVMDHGHHHRKKHVAAKPAVTLNVTSMVDILFNLLVYFVVTANFSMDEGSLKTKLPPPANNAPSATKEEDLDGSKQILDVASTKDGYGYVLRFKGQNIPDFAALNNTLRANNKALNPGGKINPDLDTILIQPGAKVRWQHVVNAFNQTVAAGYKKVGFGEISTAR